MLVLYFCNFTNGLSDNSSEWSNFGAYLGSITGLLAFAGILYSIQQSSISHTENSERETFFQLLELHTNKMNSVEFKDAKGAEAFKEYVNMADYLLNIELIKCYVSKQTISFDVSKNLKDSNEICYYLRCLYSIYNNSPYDACLKISEKNYYTLMRGDFLIKVSENVQMCNNLKSEIKKRILIIGKDVNSYQKITEIADKIYKEYGHITGHYFRNMFYVMRYIKGFSNNEKYVGLFRAQLSRYELALGLFNAVSSNSSKEMIDLLKEFEVFKDIYPEDITIIKILFENDEQQRETRQKKMLRITNSLLDDWKSTS